MKVKINRDLWKLVVGITFVLTLLAGQAQANIWYEEAWGYNPYINKSIEGANYTLGHIFQSSYIINVTIDTSLSNYGNPYTYFNSYSPLIWLKLDGDATDSTGTYTTSASSVNYGYGMFNSTGMFSPSTNSKINITNADSALDLPNANRSIMVVFNVTAPGATGKVIFAKNGSWWVEYIPSTQSFGLKNATTFSNVMCSNCIGMNQTYVGIITYEGVNNVNRTRVYLNGMQVASAILPITPSSKTAYVGTNGVDEYFPGNIDNVMIIPKVLNQSEVNNFTYWYGDGIINFTAGGTTVSSSNPVIISSFSENIENVTYLSSNTSYGGTYMNNTIMKYNISVNGNVPPPLSFNSKKGSEFPVYDRFRWLVAPGNLAPDYTNYFTGGQVQEWFRQSQLMDANVIYLDMSLEQFLDGHWNAAGGTGWDGSFNQTALDNFNTTLSYATQYNSKVMVTLLSYDGLHYDAVNSSYPGGGVRGVKWNSYMNAYNNFTSRYASNTTIVAWLLEEYYTVLGQASLQKYNENNGTYSSGNVTPANHMTSGTNIKQTFLKDMSNNISYADWNHTLLIEDSSNIANNPYPCALALNYSEDKTYFNYGALGCSKYNSTWPNYLNISGVDHINYLKRKNGLFGLTQVGASQFYLQYNQSPIIDGALQDLRGYDYVIPWSSHEEVFFHVGWGYMSRNIPFYWFQDTWRWNSYYANNLTALPFIFVNSTAYRNTTASEYWRTNTPTKDAYGLYQFQIIDDGISGNNRTHISEFRSYRGTALNGTNVNNTFYPNGTNFIFIIGNGSFGEKKISVVPSSGSVNITIIIHNITVDYYKKINATGNSNTLWNVGDNPINTWINVSVNGTNTSIKSNTTGYVSFGIDLTGLGESQVEIGLDANPPATAVTISQNCVATESNVNAAFMLLGVLMVIFSVSGIVMSFNSSEVMNPVMIGAFFAILVVGSAFIYVGYAVIMTLQGATC